MMIRAENSSVMWVCSMLTCVERRTPDTEARPLLSAKTCYDCENSRIDWNIAPLLSLFTLIRVHLAGTV